MSDDFPALAQSRWTPQLSPSPFRGYRASLLNFVSFPISLLGCPPHPRFTMSCRFFRFGIEAKSLTARQPRTPSFMLVASGQIPQGLLCVQYQLQGNTNGPVYCFGRKSHHLPTPRRAREQLRSLLRLEPLKPSEHEFAVTFVGATPQAARTCNNLKKYAINASGLKEQ